MKIEAEILAGRQSRSTPTQSPRRRTGPISKRGRQLPEEEMDPVIQRDGRKKASNPPLTLKDVLTAKVWNEILVPLPEEDHYACS